jgi:hypothetical protein
MHGLRERLTSTTPPISGGTPPPDGHTVLFTRVRRYRTARLPGPFAPDGQFLERPAPYSAAPKASRLRPQRIAPSSRLYSARKFPFLEVTPISSREQQQFFASTTVCSEAELVVFSRMIMSFLMPGSSRNMVSPSAPCVWSEAESATNPSCHSQQRRFPARNPDSVPSSGSMSDRARI